MVARLAASGRKAGELPETAAAPTPESLTLHHLSTMELKQASTHCALHLSPAAGDQPAGGRLSYVSAERLPVTARRGRPRAAAAK